ncbi:TIM barrel protein [Vannielia litorea]|uniref:TIM barrel protein n=1 Tax=Vannielia litorea TaxID=1217970 RepID=UPI001C951E5A|nr:TIM barrel protein [Vannielia litorea]MBY6048786.1 TIM barrel protein [Vannielia litorea]MBY6076200.1 TIM barrel protein [Vannielia litorea]
MQTAINHMTVPRLSYVELLDLAANLGCVGVEVRNDIERPLFDEADPASAGAMARDKGLRLVGLSQVYPFNSWSDTIAIEVRALIATALEAGAETISLIPRNDGTQTGNGERHANLRIALKEIQPMLADAGLVALVEPLGFPRSSLRSKTELVETIDALDAAAQFRIVHDTFHHALAEGGPIYPERTGIVHISGVTDPALGIEKMEDEHRVLVDASDRLGNIEQLRALLAAGYDGPVCYECFSPEVHALGDPEAALRASFEFISSQLAEEAA